MVGECCSCCTHILVNFMCIMLHLNDQIAGGYDDYENRQFQQGNGGNRGGVWDDPPPYQGRGGGGGGGYVETLQKYSRKNIVHINLHI